MATRKKPTPAQLAARKLFAARAKAGTLRKRKASTKRNPARKVAKRRGPGAVNAPSQATGRKPSARLKARRARNTVRGAYPNPKPRATSSGYPFRVQCVMGKLAPQSKWRTIATFAEKKRAEEYARALSATRAYGAIRVDWD